jgi:hypothetical protein
MCFYTVLFPIYRMYKFLQINENTREQQYLVNMKQLYELKLMLKNDFYCFIFATTTVYIIQRHLLYWRLELLARQCNLQLVHQERVGEHHAERSARERDGERARQLVIECQYVK